MMEHSKEEDRENLSHLSNCHFWAGSAWGKELLGSFDPSPVPVAAVLNSNVSHNWMSLCSRSGTKQKNQEAENYSLVNSLCSKL